MTRTLARHERTIEQVAALDAALDDAEVLIELAVEEDDPTGLEEAIAELRSAETTLSRLERETLFFGPYDDSTAIVSVSPTVPLNISGLIVVTEKSPTSASTRG